WRNVLSFVAVDEWGAPGRPWPGSPGLNGVKRGHGAAEESAVRGWPPRVDDTRCALADNLVVPPPHCRLDGLAHRRHMLEVVVVFRRLIRPGAPQSADCRRGRMKDIDIELHSDPPRTPGIGIGR